MNMRHPENFYSRITVLSTLSIYKQNSDKIIDLSDGKNTAILEVNGRHCMLTFDGHIVSAKNGSFFSLYNLIPIEYMPKRRHIYSGICALYNDKYYMVYTCLLNNNWSGYGVSTSSDGYIYLTGQSRASNWYNIRTTGF